MNKRRLRKLVEGLRSLTRAQSRHFDMWFICILGENDEGVNRLPIKKLDCGTAACAIGWSPTFFPKSLYISNYEQVVYVKNGMEYRDFKAAQEFFEISDNESYYLFDPTYYHSDAKLTPKYVARRIEEFVESNGKNCQKYYDECDMAVGSF